MTTVLSGLAKIALEMALFEALASLFPNSNMVTAFGRTVGVEPESKATGGRIAAFKPVKLHRNEVVLPMVPGRVINAAAAGGVGGMTLNQAVNFNISAIDSKDAARFVKEQKGAIAQVVADAAQSSLGFRRQLGGR